MHAPLSKRIIEDFLRGFCEEKGVDEETMYRKLEQTAAASAGVEQFVPAIVRADDFEW